MKIIDTHTHTNFSFDGENTPREMIEQALKLGLHAIAFTDHIDVNDYYGSYYKESELMPRGALEIPPLIEEYKEKINIGFGSEIGQFMHAPALAGQLIEDFKLDYVIGSVHNTRSHDDFYTIDFRNYDHKALLQQYFEEMLEMAAYADIDVIGHMTYPLRRISGKYNIAVDMSIYADIIREILKTAITKNIGLEINTGGLRVKGYNNTEPGLAYIRLFRELGGEIITVGSDAHRVSDLAANFITSAEIAKAAGFKQLAYFIERKPVFVDLI